MDVGRSTAAVLRGDDDLSTWTLAELTYGARRNHLGHFPRKPKVIAAAVHDELIRRKMKKAVRLLESKLHAGAKVLVSIIEDPDATNRDRLKAIQLLFERVLGLPRQTVHLGIDNESIKPWQRMMVEAIVATEEQARALPPKQVENEADPDDEIIEGEIVEEPAPVRVRYQGQTRSVRPPQRLLPRPKDGEELEVDGQVYRYVADLAEYLPANEQRVDQPPLMPNKTLGKSSAAISDIGA